MYTFGENENGKLGLSGTQLNETRIPQPLPSLKNDKYTKVACGARHTVALTEYGVCYSWGDGSHGQLGHGTMVLEMAQPRKIEFLNSENVIDVACGDSHTAVITGIIGIFIGQFFQKRMLLLVLLVKSQFSQKEKDFFSFFFDNFWIKYSDKMLSPAMTSFY